MSEYGVMGLISSIFQPRFMKRLCDSGQVIILHYTFQQFKKKTTIKILSKILIEIILGNLGRGRE